MISDGFTKIPNIIADMRLSPAIFRMYAHYKRRAGDNGLCWETVDHQAKSCRLAKETVIKVRNELQRLGLIEVIPAKINKHLGYHIKIVDTSRIGRTQSKIENDQGLKDKPTMVGNVETKNNP